MNLTPLKYLLFIENVTSVFRNYLCLKTRTRIIVLFWVFIEAVTISITTVANFEPDSENEVHYNKQAYFFLSTGFSIYLLIASLLYSKSFYRLLLNFDAFNKYFDDSVYYRKMLQAQKNSTYAMVIVFFFIIFLFTYLRWHNSDGNMEWVVTIVILYCLGMSDIRYILQYFVLHCIMFVISEQVKVITRSIDSELSAMKENRGDVERAELSSVTVKHDKYYKWLKAYETINDSANLCNSVFSIQLTIMLLTVTVYYIILTYTMITTVIDAVIDARGVSLMLHLFTNLLPMAAFLSLLLLISRVGQQIQNSYVQLRQKLCKLCVHTLENEEYYKLAKDLLRYVRTRPVRVHVFGTLDVNMSMLPSVVTFFNLYTVIALQFNNVV